ncbi:chorismate mutase [Wansuia hejianensis]|uniref:chorismate mutase n=1 Tax=Wansuia hejianensis TaxID=2763667 RepID=A0A926INC3_9FIRM|nr:chorismate mutase [Wansuia hejianensis]MBC8590548.1 chorismate mutase [Wansuia hejianensis]
MNTVAIRGAITIEENTQKSILEGTTELLLSIQEKNKLVKENVAAIVFTCTNDLDKVAPAKAAREIGYVHTALMCFNEMNVENSLEKCIRIMILYNCDTKQKDVKHCYLRGAQILRPDLI